MVATRHVIFMSELHWRQEVGTELLSYEGIPTHVQHLGHAVLLAPRGIVQDAPSSPADEHEVRAAAALDESGRVTVRRQGATALGTSEPPPPVRGDR